MIVARRWVDVAALAVGLAVFFACAAVARSGVVGSAELGVFHAINGLPEWLSPIMTKVQFLGVLAVGPVVALGALAAMRWRLALAVLLVTALKLAAERTVWFVLDIHRERPGTTVADAVVRGGTPTTGVSFVSGHVILTTGIAWVLTPWLPARWRWTPWAVVVLVGFARMYLGAHNPLDVLGGLALGVVVGALALLVTGVPSAERTRSGPRARW